MSAAVLFAACLVIGVADGDTIRVKCPQRVNAFVVRIAEIDAPEKANRGFGWEAQPFNVESQQHLAALCRDKHATVRRIGFDRDRRALGQVKCEGVDVAAYQLAAGLAWANAAYLSKGSTMPAIEAQARAEKRGLWADEGAIAPWLWRKAGKC